jgi:DNA-binding transcriptional LysR family regulator
VLPVVLAWRPQHDVSPAARAFVDYILDEVATGAEIGPPVPGPVTEP